MAEEKLFSDEEPEGENSEGEDSGIDEEKLLSAIEAEEGAAYGRNNDLLNSDRALAIQYYLGEPFGDEVDGRSQFVSRDVADTVEWIKPSLMRIFTSGEEVARFDPTGPEDVDQAQQETDYINYIVQQKNNWFDICNVWFHDGLVTKNAYAMAYWDEKEDNQKETYEGKSEDELAFIAQDKEVEIIKHSTNEDGTHDFVVQRKKTYGCAKLVVLPPEQCLVSERTDGRSVMCADFFEYWSEKTISELRAMGFDVDDDIEDGRDTSIGNEREARNQYNEVGRLTDIRDDPAMRRVTARAIWIKYDADADGVAEYRQCVLVGRTFLHNEEVSCIPVGCVVPIPLPHRHPGQSVADQVMDIQRIKSALLRQNIDNTFLQNNGRMGISNRVNLDDFLTSRPGGAIRVDTDGPDVAGHLTPVVHPYMGEKGLRFVEYMDQVRENRTGTNRYFTGTDSNALNKTASGISQLTSASAQRVELVARVFAEGVKELLLIVHMLTLKHSRQAEVVRLRNQWVTIDPRQWKKRTDMSLSVGLGTGNKETVIGHLGMLAQWQEKGMMIGIATPDNAYNLAAEASKAMGFAAPEKFWTKPGPENQPPPSPEQIKAQGEQQKMQGEMQMKQQEHQLEMQKAAAELQFKREELELKKQEMLLDLQMKREELQLKQQEMAMQGAMQEQNFALERDKAILEKDKAVADFQMRGQEQELKKEENSIKSKPAETTEKLVGDLQTTLQELTKVMSAPRRLVRGPDGKAAGSELAQ